MTNMNQITLRPAYVWDCDECGREVFERGCIPELSEEEIAELRDEHGVEDFEDGHFIMMPVEVECPYCGATFLTQHFSEEW